MDNKNNNQLFIHLPCKSNKDYPGIVDEINPYFQIMFKIEFTANLDSKGSYPRYYIYIYGQFTYIWID